MNRCLGLLLMGLVSVACSQESSAGADLALPGDLGAPDDLAALPDDAANPDQAMMDGAVSGPTLSLIAGGLGGKGFQDGLGAAARFNNPGGAVLDGAGNLYLADIANNTIRKVVVATGAVTTLAGFPGAYGPKDGVGAAARFYRPSDVALDGAGNLNGDYEPTYIGRLTTACRSLNHERPIRSARPYALFSPSAA